ncbi:Lipoprotein signal peptidase [Heracleum sosnowskyi]|uniref:Lipoprotein signal peptidase n=1 Tax=Heracleum sosnowskyi TaxID=360622 RepID=A0AAD8HZ45_9APIA|nr:Lipoprotein signal peptidase [Heracleum sosnowskyi]
MGSRNIIWMMFYVSLTPFLIIRGTLADKNSDHDSRSLDKFLHDYAQKVVKLPSRGEFYDISLHSNYSGMKISYVQIETTNLWARGINSSLIHIPRRTRTRPSVKRLDIVFHHLGNLSSYYFSLPNHKFVTPVIGFTAYNGEKYTAANRSSVHKLKLEGNNTIVVRFEDSSLKKGEMNPSKRCVRFYPNGHVAFSKVGSTNLCHVHGQGHFAIVVRKWKPFWKRKTTKWWAIGIGVGIGVLFLGILVWILVRNFGRKKKVKSMQMQSERSEALDTVWVGTSKMPSAGGIRTQPVLENDYLP